MRVERTASWWNIAAVVLLVLIVALGVGIRLKEPLSSPALGAEDPFTHIVFTNEALERGWFGDSWYLGTGLYPPGLHAFAGILATLSGVDLYDFARFAPIGFAALAIVGIYVLAARLGGPAAGLTAALLTAVMPEHAFRTELFFPTALDVALVPAFLLAVYASFASREPDQRWATCALAAGMGVALAFLHPWLVPLFAAPALAFVALRALRLGLPARETARSLVPPALAATTSVAFAMSSRWDKSDTGFADFFRHLGPLGVLADVSLPAPLLFVALGLVFAAAAAAGIALTALLASARGRTPRALRVGAAAAIAGVLIVLALALARAPPRDVDYRNMLGALACILALAGVVAALVWPSALGDLGLAIAVPLFPLTAIDLFDSPFWPSRTVVYLSIGVTLLAAAAVAALAERATWLARTPRRRAVVAPVAGLACVLLVAGAVAAQPPKTYSWYRLYDDHEFAAFQDLAARLDAEPDARVVVHGWQPALMIKALSDPPQARYAPGFFKDGAERQRVLDEEWSPKYVLVDKYLIEKQEEGKADLSFLSSGSYRLVDEASGGSYRLYAWEGSS